ncbi:hydrogenase maturation nickel metallochaperone HypA [Aurantivibrio infirmus]
MHEASLAEELIEIINATARREHFKHVKKVELEIGELSCVDPESLRFAIEALIYDSVLDLATINISQIPGRLQCLHCKKEFEGNSVHTACPYCQQFGTRIVGGDDMQLTELEIYEE